MAEAREHLSHDVGSDLSLCSSSSSFNWLLEVSGSSKPAPTARSMVCRTIAEIE